MPPNPDFDRILTDVYRRALSVRHRLRYGYRSSPEQEEGAEAFGQAEVRRAAPRARFPRRGPRSGRANATRPRAPPLPAAILGFAGSVAPGLRRHDGLRCGPRGARRGRRCRARRNARTLHAEAPAAADSRVGRFADKTITASTTGRRLQPQLRVFLTFLR